jgi:hypothetical protein
MPNAPTDAWTAFLEWLQTILIPDWNGLIALVPILLILGVLGPVLTLLLLYWLYVRVSSPRGRVRIDDPQPYPAERAADGAPVYPANTPYCARHALIHPPTAVNCAIDGDELVVRCPVDDNVRSASQQVCRACGTRYQLGASLTALVVRRHGSPPEGGAAIA